MRVMVNGQVRALTGEATVAQLVAGMVPGWRGVAVAVNGEVVPRTRWTAAALCDGDRVEVLTAAQGG